MTAQIVLALVMVLLGAGALLVMVVTEVSRLGVVAARRALARSRIDTLRNELDQARAQTAETEAAIEEGQARLGMLVAERERLAGLTRSVQADRVELVHEIGMPDGGPAPFRCLLRTAPDFARIDPRHVVFAREIWQRRNVAHIWADTPEAAYALLQRSFPARSGVLPGGIERAADVARPLAA